MTEPGERSPHLGIVERYRREADLAPAEIGTLVVGVLWLAASSVLAATLWRPGPDPLAAMLAIQVVILPAALILVGALVMRSARIMQTEAARLRDALDTVRRSQIGQQRSAGTTPPPAADGGRRPPRQGFAEAQAPFAAAPSAPAAPPVHPSAADARPPQQARHEERQRALDLGGSEAAPPAPVANADFLRALNFPETAEDTEGVRALRRALADRAAAEVLRSAQDVLTLLGGGGIYMEDVAAPAAPPAAWRAFAGGVRGAEIAALGGAGEAETIEAVQAWMKSDPVFRDAAHHFLRRFDRMLADFVPELDDAQVADFARTRSAHAFLLLGRAAGLFG